VRQREVGGIGYADIGEWRDTILVPPLSNITVSFFNLCVILITFFITSLLSVPSSLPAIWLNQSRCSVGWNIGVVFSYNSWAYLYFILYHRKFFDAPQYTHLLQRTELIWEHYFCTERRKKCIVHEKHKTFKIFLLLYISACQLQYQVTMQMIRKTTFFIFRNPYSYWRHVNCNYSTEYAWGNTKLPLKSAVHSFPEFNFTSIQEDRNISLETFGDVSWKHARCTFCDFIKRVSTGTTLQNPCRN